MLRTARTSPAPPRAREPIVLLFFMLLCLLCLCVMHFLCHVLLYVLVYFLCLESSGTFAVASTSDQYLVRTMHWKPVLTLMCTYTHNPRIPHKRLQTQEATLRKQGDASCILVFDVYDRPVFSESLLGFGVSSGEFRDILYTTR